MSAGHLQRIVSADGRVLLVNGQHLPQLDVELVVDVELHATRQGGPGPLLVGVPGIGGDRLSRLDIRGIAEVQVARPEARVTLEALLLELLPAGVADVRRQREGFLHQALRVVLCQTPAEREAVVDVVEPPLLSGAVLEAEHASLDRPLL